MSHIIVLLREVLLGIHDRRMKKKVDEAKYSILEKAILVALKLALLIEEEEGERSNFK